MWGGKTLDQNNTQAVLMSNYLYIGVPEWVYNRFVDNLPYGFTPYSHGANTFWGTNDTAVCQLAKDTFDPIQFTFGDYNLRIPSSGYIIDFSQGSAETHIFDADKCGLMLQPTFFTDAPDVYVLGDTFLWSFFTQLDWANNEVDFGVNVFAADGTMIIEETGPLGYFNMFPHQQFPENYLTNQFTIGEQFTTNSTIDINAPYTSVNVEGCTNCHFYFTGYNVTEDFATYIPENSMSFQNLSDTTPFD